MIANFFQSLNRHNVGHLLISGQATVLYGAATFSEDIDLWVNPAPDNSARLLSALRECHALYYKLTPPVAPEYLAHGHGFHFVLPGSAGSETFLDVMGVPPRVGPFTAATATARWMDTEWGRLHTIGLKDLVELKKTQRLEDYPIISNLALAWFDQPESAQTSADFNWALDNIFTLTALRNLFEEHPVVVELASGEMAAELKVFGEQILAGREAPENLEQQLTAWMQQRMSALQQTDRRYWREIIIELKQLRATGQLMTEGSAV